MRVWFGPLLLVSSVASADGTALHVRQLGEDEAEPLLHLDATMFDPIVAPGAVVERRAAVLELGPRVDMAAEGAWWQSDLPGPGWRAAGELSYDLGPFRIGVNAAMTRDGDSTHRLVGLFAYRTFRLSHWMHAWIVLGLAFEQWQVDGLPGARQGVTAGLTVGTTFR